VSAAVDRSEQRTHEERDKPHRDLEQYARYPIGALSCKVFASAAFAGNLTQTKRGSQWVAN